MSGAVDVAVAFARRKRSLSAPVAVVIQKSPKFVATQPPPIPLLPSLLCFEVPNDNNKNIKVVPEKKNRRRSVSPLGIHQRPPNSVLKNTVDTHAAPENKIRSPENSTDVKKKRPGSERQTREFVVVIGRERTASPSPSPGSSPTEAAVAIGGMVARTRMRSSSRHRNSGSPVARLLLEKKMSETSSANNSNINIADAKIAAMRKLASGAGYELGERLGAGGFSEVWTVWQKRNSRQKHAGKFFICSDPDEVRRYTICEHYARELRAQNLLAEYRRRHVDAEKRNDSPCSGMTGLYDYFQTPLGAEPDARCVVVSLAAGGDLIDGLNCRECLGERECRELARNLFTALATIHECRLVHADVKPDNVYLLDKNDVTRVTLGDFGLAEETPDDDPEMPLVLREKARNESDDDADDLSVDGSESLRDLIDKDESDDATAASRRGTLDYMSPEVVHGDMMPIYESDVWGAGLTCLLAIIGRNPFAISKYSGPIAENVIEYMSILHSNGPDIIQWELKKRGVSRAAEQFFADALALSPYDRPSARECLDSDWLARQ